MAISAAGDGLTAGRDRPIGGQAVMEGVMMRGVAHWAVAVRAPVQSPSDPSLSAPVPLVGCGTGGSSANGAAPDPEPTSASGQLGRIEVRTFDLRPPSARSRLWRLPILRGVFALGSSLAIGMRALGISANVAVGEEQEEISSWMWIVAVAIAVVFAVGLFFVVPVTLTNLIKHQLGSSVLFWTVEGVIRTAIFLGYLALLTRIRDLRRVLEYHGAEHKVISCYEAGDELTPQRAKLYSRLHPRCGTSFLLIVMILAIFAFAPIGLPAWWVLVTTRILGVPVIAGVAFELIKWAGRNRARPWVRAVMAPGMALQRLTTAEPDLDQLAVSIASLKAVLALEPEGSADDLLGIEVVA